MRISKICVSLPCVIALIQLSSRQFAFLYELSHTVKLLSLVLHVSWIDDSYYLSSVSKPEREAEEFDAVAQRVDPCFLRMYFKAKLCQLSLDSF